MDSPGWGRRRPTDTIATGALDCCCAWPGSTTAAADADADADAVADAVAFEVAVAVATPRMPLCCACGVTADARATLPATSIRLRDTPFIQCREGIGLNQPQLKWRMAAVNTREQTRTPRNTFGSFCEFV